MSSGDFGRTNSSWWCWYPCILHTYRCPYDTLQHSQSIKLTFADTLVQDGEIPVRLDKSGKVLERGRKRETKEFNGRTFLMETALTGDVAILRAWKVDKAGNCVFR